MTAMPGQIPWTGSGPTYCLGIVKLATLRRAEGVALLSRGLNLARRLGDPETFWLAANVAGMAWVTAPQHAEERLRLAEELSEVSRTGVSNIAVARAFRHIRPCLPGIGAAPAAEDAWSEYRDIAQRTRQPGLQIRSMQHDAILAAMDGRLEEAVEIC